MLESMLEVEVAYARPDKQTLLAVRLVQGATVADAVHESGILDLYPEIPWPDVEMGIFSRKVSADRVLADGERVEIYRPLIVDPKDRRRARAQSRD